MPLPCMSFRLLLFGNSELHEFLQSTGPSCTTENALVISALSTAPVFYLNSSLGLMMLAASLEPNLRLMHLELRFILGSLVRQMEYLLH